jgi:amino acid transporter
MTKNLKVLGLRDITLYTVSAMLFMDQIALASSLGSTSLFWWGYVLLFLFIPMSMITAELGTTFPENGGLCQWVRRAFGHRWGARVSWYYWFNNVIWMPSVFILFAGMLSELFLPDISLWPKVGIGMLLAVITAYCNTISMETGKWLPNIGAILKVICVLVLGGGGIHYGINNGFANDMSWQAIIPSTGSAIAAMGVMAYGIVGTEVACSSANEMKNPKRDIPRALLISGLIIGIFNILGTLGVLSAVPIEEAKVTQIFTKSLINIYGKSGVGYYFAIIIACFVLFTMFTNMVTWTMGTNRAAVTAAESGEFPKVFGIVHPKYKTPVGSAYTAAFISCTLLFLFGLMADSAEDLFWALMSFFAIIFLIPYVIMPLAFARLRFTDPTHRVFKMPVSNTVALIIASFISLNIIAAMIFFLYTPSEPIDWYFLVQVTIGVAVTIAYGEYMISTQSSKNINVQNAEIIKS